MSLLLLLGAVLWWSAIGLVVLRWLPELVSIGSHERQRWLRLAQEMGIAVTNRQAFATGTRRILRGRSGPLAVTIQVDKPSGNIPAPFVIAVAVSGRDPGFSLRPAFGLLETGVGPRLLRGRSCLATGDPTLDGIVHIHGEAAAALARLDAATRRRICSMDTDDALKLAGGEVTARFREGADFALHRRIGDLLEIGHLLLQPLDVRATLTANARRDPLGAVRLANLRALREVAPDHPETASAWHDALADDDAEVRLAAALQEGTAGVQALQDLARDPGLEDAVSSEAISALGPRLGAEGAVDVLHESLLRRRTVTAAACIETLRTLRAGADALVKVMAVEKDVLAPMAADALAHIADPSTEEALIEALGRNVPGLAAAAAHGLARVGTVRAVAPLHHAATAFDAETTRAARQAIAHIQSRLPGASPGQISLAEGAGGQLSLPDREGGGVSLADDASGRVSVTRPRSQS